MPALQIASIGTQLRDQPHLVPADCRGPGQRRCLDPQPALQLPLVIIKHQIIKRQVEVSLPCASRLSGSRSAPLSWSTALRLAASLKLPGPSCRTSKILNHTWECRSRQTKGNAGVSQQAGTAHVAVPMLLLPHIQNVDPHLRLRTAAAGFTLQHAPAPFDKSHPQAIASRDVGAMHIPAHLLAARAEELHRFDLALIVVVPPKVHALVDLQLQWIGWDS